MLSFPRALLAAAAFAMVPCAAQAAPHATSQDAQALLDKAANELATVGAPRALAEFNAPSGGFRTSELYVFVFTLKGVYEASGAQPKLVGTDAIDMTDAEGKPLVREFIRLAMTQGAGEVDYVWLNRGDNRVEHKRTYVRRVGDHIVGVGYYAG